MNNPTATQTSLKARIIRTAHRLCWVTATAASAYLAISLGTAEVTRNPLAIAGLMLVGVGLIREAKGRVGVA